MYGVYTKETADAIYSWYKSQVRHTADPISPGAKWVPIWYFVRLVEDLDAATDPETGYTQALANVVKYTNTVDNLDRSEVAVDELRIKVTNRSTSFSGVIGDYFWVVKPHDVAEFIPLVPAGGSRVQVTLDEDLFAPPDWTKSTKSAVCTVWEKNSSGRMVNSGKKIVVVNRFENIEVEAGTIAKAEPIDGEWQLYAVDCPSFGSSSSSSS